MDKPVAFLRVAGDIIPSSLVYAAGVQEVFMEMVDELQNVALH